MSVFFLSACALCSTLALAPSPSPSPSASQPPEIAHVTTGTRYDTTVRNTARTIYVIDRADIERNGYRTVAQALTDVPALVISPLGAIGAGANFTLRGSSSAQTLFLIDGLPAPGSFSNSVAIGNLSTAGVDRIEIVEGGGSTLYGSGAIGGIVNIITHRHARPELVLRAGSFGDQEIQVSTPWVQYDRIVADNNYPLPNGTTRDFTSYRSTDVHANLAHTFGSFDVALRASIESDHLGAPGPIEFLTPSAQENDENEDANLTLTHRSAQAIATLQAGGTLQHIAFFCDTATDLSCFQPSIALSTDSRVMLALRNVVRGANNQLVYGADLSRGVVRSDDGFGDIVTSPLSQTAAYAEEHYETAWGSVYAGLRGERDGTIGGEFSPSAGFVWHAGTGVELKGNAATAFRAPNATELFFPFYGNPSLKPERAQVADLTLSDSSLAGGVSLGWFHNRTRNLIEATPVAAFGTSCIPAPASMTYEACNVDHAFIQGLTFTAATKPVRGITSSLTITDLYRAQDLDTGTRLPNDPVFNTSLRLDYSALASGTFVQNWGIAGRSSGARGTVNFNKPLFDQPQAFTSIDAYVGVRAGNGLLLTLRGYNLGNERYAAVNGFPLPGRSYIVEFSAK